MVVCGVLDPECPDIFMPMASCCCVLVSCPVPAAVFNSPAAVFNSPAAVFNSPAAVFNSAAAVFNSPTCTVKFRATVT